MSKANIETVTAYESGYEHGEGVGYKHGYKQGKAEGEQVALGTSRMLEAAREELNCQDTEIGQLKTDRDEWKRRALEAEAETGRLRNALEAADDFLWKYLDTFGEFDEENYPLRPFLNVELFEILGPKNFLNRGEKVKL